MLVMPLLSVCYQKLQIKRKGVLLMALDKVVGVDELEGEPMPAHRIEVLKDLIRKAAFRRLKRMTESASEAASIHLGPFFEPHLIT